LEAENCKKDENEEHKKKYFKELRYGNEQGVDVLSKSYILSEIR
jgi:hypothetical protein